YEPNHNNPLSPTLFSDIDKGQGVHTNNYIIINIPYLKGLNYSLNTALRYNYYDRSRYEGRNTLEGYTSGGSSMTERQENKKALIDNIISYQEQFFKHRISATLLY